MKKFINTILIIVIILTFVPETSIASVHNADAPIDTAGLKWKIKLGDGYANSPTHPLISGEYLYTCTNDKLYKLNKNTGEVVSKVILAGRNTFSLVPPSEDDDSIYVPIGSGRIQALDKKTLKSKWVSKKSLNDVTISGQTITEIKCKDGKIYTGTWGNGGQYYCIDANTTDGSITWIYDDPNGFYWAGAYVDDDNIVFGSDSTDDKLSTNSQIICLDNDTGEVKSTMSAVGSVRGAVESDGTGNFYVSTKGKVLYKFSLNNNGALIEEGSILLSGESTGGVTVYQGKIYVGTSAKQVDVIDAETMTRTFYIPTPGYPQGGVLITERSDSGSYLYSTYNSLPGGIAMAKLGENSADVYSDFFVPTDRQSGISSISIDGKSGTLYYKNDSGYLMAVATSDKAYSPQITVKSKSYNSLTVKWDKIANAAGYNIYRSSSKNGTYSFLKSIGADTTSYIDKNLKTGQKYYYRVQAKYKGTKGTMISGKSSAISYATPELSKPKLKTKKKKKAVNISWNRVNGASGYVIYRATSKKGKYKKIKKIKKGSIKTWTNKKLKSKKKYFYKIKAYRKVDEKKVYSVYSNISYKKTK